MYPGNIPEQVSVVGTPAFMDFVERITAEGVVLDHKPMDSSSKPAAPLVVEIDEDKTEDELAALEFGLPVLTPRVYREYKSLSELSVAAMAHQKILYRQFSPEEQREIVFRDVAHGNITHTTVLDTAGVADYRNVIGYFAQTVMRDLRLISGYDILYGKVKQFVRDELFGHPVELEDINTLRNLSEIEAQRAILEGFKKGINALTVKQHGDAKIRRRGSLKLRETRPFIGNNSGLSTKFTQESSPTAQCASSGLQLRPCGIRVRNRPDVLAHAEKLLCGGLPAGLRHRNWGNFHVHVRNSACALRIEQSSSVETKGT